MPLLLRRRLQVRHGDEVHGNSSTAVALIAISIAILTSLAFGAMALYIYCHQRDQRRRRHPIKADDEDSSRESGATRESPSSLAVDPHERRRQLEALFQLRSAASAIPMLSIDNHYDFLDTGSSVQCVLDSTTYH
ncbi:Aste57867_10034 [Aphanomyces stellatus]|uniref:Aste57867_10034 protein n=1 Tax=Aphanomyces stellatus TaxID=120398 RepID=A0A485KPV6_9STRA|nr:hypothetical protein As57867_009995 [Aphanomyces stellatus]VFT86911.1 Aste57867_10034 [Aphanomyces stellatus]